MTWGDGAGLLLFYRGIALIIIIFLNLCLTSSYRFHSPKHHSQVRKASFTPITSLLFSLFQIIILSKFIFRSGQLLLENPLVRDLIIPNGSIFANYTVLDSFVIPYPTYPTYLEKQAPILLDSVVYTYYYLLTPLKTIVQQVIEVKIRIATNPKSPPIDALLPKTDVVELAKVDAGKAQYSCPLNSWKTKLVDELAETVPEVDFCGASGTPEP